jgi:hypothetical protein
MRTSQLFVMAKAFATVGAALRGRPVCEEGLKYDLGRPRRAAPTSLLTNVLNPTKSEREDYDEKE